MPKLSKPQERAYSKLLDMGDWCSADLLRERMVTLRILWKKGLVYRQFCWYRNKLVWEFKTIGIEGVGRCQS